MRNLIPVITFLLFASMFSAKADSGTETSKLNLSYTVSTDYLRNIPDHIRQRYQDYTFSVCRTPKPVCTNPDPICTTPEPICTTTEPICTTKYVKQKCSRCNHECTKYKKVKVCTEPETTCTTPDPICTTPKPICTTPEPECETFTRTFMTKQNVTGKKDEAFTKHMIALEGAITQLASGNINWQFGGVFGLQDTELVAAGVAIGINGKQYVLRHEAAPFLSELFIEGGINIEVLRELKDRGYAYIDNNKPVVTKLKNSIGVGSNVGKATVAIGFTHSIVLNDETVSFSSDAHVTEIESVMAHKNRNKVYLRFSMPFTLTSW